MNDQRGAVMVLGIFMCTVLVGALWYLAGIGDAIIFRERVQEAADASAFSGAVLHARGMNIIVLINLLMACILGIRVALKVVQLTLLIVGAILTALSFIPGAQGLATLAGFCFDGAAEIQSILGTIKPEIDNALKALSKLELGIQHAVPFAACAGGRQVGMKYSTTITGAVSVIGADTIANGLPLEEGSGERLCFEAGRAFGSLMWWAVSLGGSLDFLKGGKAGDKFANVVGKIVERGGAYFCENGSGGSAPNLDDIFDENANESCDGERKDLQDKYNASNAAWHAKCDEYGAFCTDPDPIFGPGAPSNMSNISGLPLAKQSELQGLQSKRDADQQKYEQFDWDACKKKRVKEMKDQVAAGQSPGGGSGNSQDMTPKKTKADWRNGAKPTQVMGWVWGDTKSLRTGPKGVKVGAMKSRVNDIKQPTGTDFAFAQAEYFYDCGPGEWKSNECNGMHRDDNEDAMWHFKWRARLRRYNRPYNDIDVVMEIPYVITPHTEMVANAAEAPLLDLVSPGNVALKGKLVKFANPADTMSVVLH